MRVDVVGPVVSRVFNPNNAMADRMKHLVEPQFSIQRRTEDSKPGSLIPDGDRAYDKIVGGVTQMSYGLTNRLMVRKDEGQPQSSSPREMLNVSAATELLHRARTGEPVRPVVQLWLQRARGECLLADRADRARDADHAARHRLPR